MLNQIQYAREDNSTYENMVTVYGQSCYVLEIRSLFSSEKYWPSQCLFMPLYATNMYIQPTSVTNAHATDTYVTIIYVTE